MRWVLVTEERIGQEVVRSLPLTQEVAAVVTSNPVIRRFCRSREIRCEPPSDDSIARLPQMCQELDATVLLNLHGMRILPADELAAAGVMGLNVHPSVLPDLAGLYPYAWAIQLNRQQHGVTVHRMVDKLDAGDIMLQEMWPLEGDETAGSLFERCEQQAKKMILNLLGQSDAEFHATFDAAQPQDSGRCYYGKQAIAKEVVLTTDMDCETAARLVRSRDFRPFVPPWKPPVLEIGQRAIHVIGLEETAEPIAFRDGSLCIKLRDVE